jgi:hypothetical protein
VTVGCALRKIATLTGLGLRTVQSITGKAAGTDRTSVRRGALERIVRDRAEAERDNIKLAGLRRQQRTRDWLPKRITAVQADL